MDHNEEFWLSFWGLVTLIVFLILVVGTIKGCDIREKQQEAEMATKGYCRSVANYRFWVPCAQSGR